MVWLAPNTAQALLGNQEMEQLTHTGLQTPKIPTQPRDLHKAHETHAGPEG
jgi:hypothetical protein